MPFTWTELSPAGVAPVAVLRVEGVPTGLELRDVAGRLQVWPTAGRVTRAWAHDAAGSIGDVLIAGDATGGELHLHGGAALQQRIRRWLELAGGEELVNREAGPGLGGIATSGSAAPVPGCWRAVRAAISCRFGPLAALCRRLDPSIPVSPGDAEKLRRALALRSFARRLREPPLVVLAGPENAGKSTLFNALLGSARALASPIAGTTRDRVEDVVVLRGVPVRLMDTAGSPRGVLSVTAEADLVLAVLEAPEALDLRSYGASRVRAVLGKADLRPASTDPTLLRISGRTGEGLASLVASMASDLDLPPEGEADAWTPWDPEVERRLVSGVRDSDPA